MLNIGYKFPYSNYSIDILTDTSLPRASMAVILCFPLDGCGFSRTGIRSQIVTFCADFDINKFIQGFLEPFECWKHIKKSANVLPLQKIPHNRLLHQHRLLPCL